jgi:hypothetical protein
VVVERKPCVGGEMNEYAMRRGRDPSTLVWMRILNKSPGASWRLAEPVVSQIQVLQEGMMILLYTLEATCLSVYGMHCASAHKELFSTRSSMPTRYHMFLC